MHECYKLSHTSCTTFLSRCAKALFALLTVPENIQGAHHVDYTAVAKRKFKAGVCVLILGLLSILSRQPKCVTHYCSGSMKISCRTHYEKYEIFQQYFFSLWLLHKQRDSASFIFSLKGKNPETDFVFWHF